MKIFDLLYNYMNRDKMIFCEQSRKTKRNAVNLHWYSTKREDKIENFGDYLSVVVCREVAKQKGIDIDKSLNKTKHLYAIGSIIFYGFQVATIWGSGLLHEAKKFRTPNIYKLDIRAVRGPMTRASLIKNGFSVPQIYGDPAILMPLFYTPRKLPLKDYVVIAHKNISLDIEKDKVVNILTDDYSRTIDEIVNSKLVISGSLHGIIIAESYGVPAILMYNISDPTDGDLFKYKDWYYSTGRKEFPMVHSISEALQTKPPELPDLSKMQEDIMQAFPADLWE